MRLHTHLGVLLAKVADLLRTGVGPTVTAGGPEHVLHRAARDAAGRMRCFAKKSETRRWSRQTKPSRASVLSATGCGRSPTPDTTVYAIRGGLPRTRVR